MVVPGQVEPVLCVVAGAAQHEGERPVSPGRQRQDGAADERSCYRCSLLRPDAVALLWAACARP